MAKEEKTDSTYTSEYIVRWVISRAEATREPGATLPAWMTDAFDDAMKQDDEAAGTTTHREDADDKSTKHDRVFKFELVYLKVEDTVFTVIKDWFMVEDSTFQGMFALPTARGMNEGTKITNPIVLEQTSASSFRAFLNLLYGSRGESLQTYDEWVGALDLALRWNFSDIRKQAIAGLNSLLPSLGPAARIRLARRFSVGPWLRSGLFDLVTEVSEQRLTREEIMDNTKFPLDTTTVANVFFACFKLTVDALNHKSGSITPEYCQHQLQQVQNLLGPFGIPYQGIKVETYCSLPLCQALKEAGMSLAKEAIVENIFGLEIHGCLYHVGL